MTEHVKPNFSDRKAYQEFWNKLPKHWGALVCVAVLFRLEETENEKYKRSKV